MLPEPPPDTTNPDSLFKTEHPDESAVPPLFRAFSYILVAVVLLPFMLQLTLVVVFKGFSSWSLVYNRPGTWVFMALFASLAPRFTRTFLARKSIEVSDTDHLAMLVTSRGVAACFFVIGVLAVGNT